MENDTTQTSVRGGGHRPRRSALGFVTVFVFVAVGLLIAYHYGEEATANKKYLEITTRHTAALLLLIGDRAEVSTQGQWPRCNFELSPGKSVSLIVAPECGAIEVMSIFIAAVLAFPTRFWRKLLGVLLGLPLLYGLNVARVACLFVIGALDTDGKYLDFAHHYVWQTVYIVFVVMVWLAWVRYVVERRA
jgi:exosortase H (IPTLxxWG-CTERM-specific)